MRFLAMAVLAVVMALIANVIIGMDGATASKVLPWENFVVFSTIAIAVVLNITGTTDVPVTKQRRVSAEVGLVAVAETCAALVALSVLIVGIVSMISAFWGRFQIETCHGYDSGMLAFLKWWMRNDFPTWGFLVTMVVAGTIWAAMESAGVWAASEPLPAPKRLTAAEKRELWCGVWGLMPWLATAALFGTWTVYMDDSPAVTEVTLATALYVWLVVVVSYVLIWLATRMHRRLKGRRGTSATTSLFLVPDQEGDQRAA